MRTKLFQPWMLAAVAVAIAGWMVVAGAVTKTSNLEPNKLVILSTTDVKGKTSPCG